MKFIKSLTSCLVLFSILPLLLGQSNIPNEITAPYEAEVSLSITQTAYYVLTLGNIPMGTDLSVSVTSGEDLAPKLFISKTKPQPKDVDSSDYNSVTYSGGVIFIPNGQLTGQQQLYIGLSCSQRTCDAHFAVEYTKEFFLEANKGAQTYTNELAGASSAVFRLHVPESPNANRIIINADALPRDKDTEPSIILYIKQGSDIPYTNHAQNIPRSSFYEGRTAVIYKDTSLFCTSCDFTLSLKFSQNSILRIEAHLLSDDMELGKKSYLDAVQDEKYNSFVYKVPKAEMMKDVVIDIQLQQGSLTAYIDCGKDSKDFKNFKARYTIGQANEQIILTEETHSTCGETATYSIVIYGNEPSTYNIRASLKETSNLRLSRGTPTLGTIIPGETIDYELSLPLYIGEKVIIKLEAPAGVDLSLINCRFPSECPNTVSGGYEHLELTDQEHKDFKFSYEALKLEGGGQEAVINLQENGCYPLLQKRNEHQEQASPVCVYKITLKSTDTSNQEYTLSAVLEGHQVLYSGQPERGVVSAEEILYYMLHIDDQEMLSISFQLTVLSGKAEIFVSRTIPYPTETTEATINLEGLVCFKGLEDYKGTYYIAVKGFVTSSFILTPTVISNLGQPKDYATVLEDGVPHKGVIIIERTELAEQFYKFTLNVRDDWEGSLKISALPTHGHLIITVNNNDNNIPMANYATWIARSSSLEISSSDPEFKRRSNYHVGIYVDFSDTGAFNLKGIAYTISYSLLSSQTTESGKAVSNKQHQILSPTNPYHGVIKRGYVLYFKVFVLPDDDSITIVKDANAGDVDLYLSMDAKIQYPSPKEYTQTTKGTHNNYIRLDDEDLALACKGDVKKGECHIYFSVSTTSNHNEVPFTVSLEKRHSGMYNAETYAVPLEDGKERQFTLPKAGEFALFYFYTMPREDTFIDVFCSNKNIVIYANLKGVSGANSKSELIYPTQGDAKYTSGDNDDLLNTGAAHLLIPSKDILAGSVVTIALTFEDYSQPGVSTASKTFTIVASSKMKHIYTGKAYRGVVLKEAYQYFTLEVTEPTCTLLVALTSLDDGDPDLFLSFGTHQKPTIDKHKFASTSRQRTELIEVNNKDIYPQESMKGQWTIGVYGKRPGSFLLTVSYEDQKMIQLHQGIPAEIYLKSSSKLYFKYYHDKKRSLTIKVERQSGQLALYVKSLDPHHDLYSNLPNSTDHTWSITKNDESVIKIGEDDPKACSDCLYLMEVVVQQGSKFSVVVSEAGGFTLLQNSLRYTDQLQPGENKRYMITFKTFEELTLSASISSGLLDVYAMNNPTVNYTNFQWELHLNPYKTFNVLEMTKKEYDEAQHIKSIWNGEQRVMSQRNVFYFDFNNSGNAPTEYSFSILTPESSSVLTSNEFHDFKFKENEEKSFLYYSPHVTGTLEILMKYCITHTHSGESLDERLSEFLEGFTFTANFWSEKTTAGIGTEVAPLKNDVMLNNVQENMNEQNQERAVCIKQLIEIDDQDIEGRYEFWLKNTYQQPVDLYVRVDATSLNYKQIDRNVHFKENLEPTQSKKFEVFFPSEGYWYLDIYSCSGSVSVAYSETLEAIQNNQVTGVILSQFGQKREFFHKVKIDEPGNKYFVVTGQEAAESLGDKEAEIIVASSYFKEDFQSEYRTSSPEDVNGPLYDPIFQHQYNFKYDESELVITFQPVQVLGTAIKDSQLFYVRLCQEGVIKNQENHCIPFHQPEECTTKHHTAPANQNEVIKMKFENVVPGGYNIHFFSSIGHNENFVRPFAYKPISLLLEEPFLNRIWDLIVFVVTLIFVTLCVYLFYNRFMKSQGDTDISKRRSEKTRTYGFVGDEDDDDKDEGDTLRNRG